MKTWKLIVSFKIKNFNINNIIGEYTSFDDAFQALQNCDVVSKCFLTIK